MASDEFGPRGARGRRLPETPAHRASGPEVPPSEIAESAPAPVDPRAPFAEHQAAPGSLSGAPDRRPAERAPFLAVATMLATGLFVFLLLGLALAEGLRPTRTPAVAAASGPRHLADPGYAGRIVDDGPPTVAAPRPATPGRIEITTSAEHDFVSIEVDCPSGYQRRGRFFPEGPGRMAASVRDVPPDEKCRVTFQGAEVATTWAYAHETRQCTFNPTVCPVR